MVILKKIAGKNICVNYVNIGPCSWLLQHVGIGTGSFQAWAVYNCFLDKWLIITNFIAVYFCFQQVAVSHTIEII